MSELKPEEFPFLLPDALFKKFECYSLDLIVLNHRACEAGLSAKSGVWLVADAEDVDRLAGSLWGLCEQTKDADDAALKAHGVFLKVQVDLTREYLRKGWRAGLYAPWCTPQTLSYYTYKVHLSRLHRSEMEPFRLVMDRPACKGYIKQAGGYTEGEAITCGMCQYMMSQRPDAYPLAR